MKIGLVGQKLLVENPAGVEKYMYFLFQGLAKTDKSNEYIVYVTKEPTKEFWENLTQGNKNFKYKVIKNSKFPFVSWIQMLLAKELITNPVDTIFYPYDTISGLLNWLMPLKFKPICMIHDLGYLKTKEYKNPIRRILHYFTIYYTIIFCKYLVVPANEVKNNVLQTYPRLKNILYKEEKIIVIPEGLNDYFYTDEKTDTIDIKQLREKYNIGKNPYLYFVSTIQPRKNIKRMIEAFSKVIKENDTYKDVKLVLSGKLGWNYEEDVTAPKEYGIEDSVLFLGRTPDEEMSTLMQNAKALINISLEEGFGLPALEAMASKTPLILSNIEVFKELAKDHAIYVNPLDIEDIKKGIITVLEGKYPKEFISSAYNISTEYTWDKAALKIRELFYAVIQKH